MRPWPVATGLKQALDWLQTTQRAWGEQGQELGGGGLQRGEGAA